MNDELNERIQSAYENIVIQEAYKVAQNPSDKLWYALGSVGKYWMPVSSGYKSKGEAEKFAKKQPNADKSAKDDLKNNLDKHVRSMGHGTR